MGEDIIEENTCITMKGQTTLMRGSRGWYLGHLINRKDKLDTCDIKYIIEWNVNNAVIPINYINYMNKGWGGGGTPLPLTPHPQYISLPLDF